MLTYTEYYPPVWNGEQIRKYHPTCKTTTKGEFFVCLEEHSTKPWKLREHIYQLGRDSMLKDMLAGTQFEQIKKVARQEAIEQLIGELNGKQD